MESRITSSGTILSSNSRIRIPYVSDIIDSGIEWYHQLSYEQEVAFIFTAGAITAGSIIFMWDYSTRVCIVSLLV